MNQQNWVQNTKGGVVNIHNAPTPSKKSSEPHPVTINTKNPELKAWLYQSAEIIRESENVDPKYGGSSLGCEAVEIIFLLLSDGNLLRRHKIRKYAKSGALQALIDKLD